MKTEIFISNEANLAYSAQFKINDKSSLDHIKWLFQQELSTMKRSY